MFSTVHSSPSKYDTNDKLCNPKIMKLLKTFSRLSNFNSLLVMHRILM